MSLKKIVSFTSALLIALSSLLPLAAAPAAAATPTNLIANASVETADPANSASPQSWTDGGWGTNKATYSYLNSGQDGSHSVQAKVSSYTSGDAKWYFSPVAVQAGSQYSFSDYYQSGVATDVVAQFDNGSGNYTYQDLGSATASTAWKQYTASFTVPATAVHVTIFHLISKVGTLTTDNFSLTGTVVTPPPTTPPPTTPPPTTPPPTTPPPTTPPPTPGTNLIANASVETADPANSALPQSWSKDKWGTNKVTYSYLNTGQDGKRSVRVQVTSYSSGDAKWYFNPVTVQQNTQYTFSDYYQSGVATDVVAQFDNGNGNYTYQELGAAPASTSWKQYTASFSAPATAVHVTIFHLISKVGTLTTDNFSLTGTAVTPPPPPPASGNLIANPSAETVDPANSTQPQYWQPSSWGTNTPSYAYLNTGQDGSRSMQVQLSNYSSGDAKWIFNPITVQPDTQYAFSDYYQSTVQTEVDAVFTMSDGSTLYQIIGLPDASATWQKFSTDFSIPVGAVNVTVYHLINRAGTLTTDNYSLQPYKPVGFNRALISLTFDDGYSDTYDYGLPILQQYGFGSTQFIITGLIGQPNYMTQAEVQALHNNGQEIASHTLTHSDLTQENPAVMTNELSQSQTTLQSWIGAPVTDLAYPYGLYNSTVMNTTKSYYSGARGVEDALNSKDNFNPYDIRVQNIFDTTTTAQVTDWVKQAQQTNTWLVLVYHSVDPSATPFGGAEWNVSPPQLSDQLAVIKASGITVETMQQALTEVTSQL